MTIDPNTAFRELLPLVDPAKLTRDDRLAMLVLLRDSIPPGE